MDCFQGKSIFIGNVGNHVFFYQQMQGCPVPICPIIQPFEGDFPSWSRQPGAGGMGSYVTEGTMPLQRSLCALRRVDPGMANGEPEPYGPDIMGRYRLDMYIYIYNINIYIYIYLFIYTDIKWYNMVIICNMLYVHGKWYM